MIKDFNVGVFTKAWEHEDPEHLGEVLAPLGVDVVELAVRHGHYINYDNCEEELPRAVEVLKKYGIKVQAISPMVLEYVNPKLINACSIANIPYVRTMQFIDLEKGYHHTYKEAVEYYSNLSSYLIEKKVKIAFQHHAWFGYWISSPAGIDMFVKSLPQGAFCTVFEPGHCIMSEPLEVGFDAIFDTMEWVTLKTGYFRNLSRAMVKETKWEHVWTTHQFGRFSWKDMVILLKKYGYTKGLINFFGQYTSLEGKDDGIIGDNILAYLKEDINRFKELVEEIF